MLYFIYAMNSKLSLETHKILYLNFILIQMVY